MTTKVEVLPKEWMELAKIAMDSEVSKEKFVEFLNEKKEAATK
ncbi:hypothetical protein P4594_28235 [Priestia megaterium]|nr:hypothetical protein [Priestia megaterium]MDP1442510.1 hypothetical protein [Priestia megaterium]MDP1471490.1 hypothetical protein [Priestia megaterium]MDR0132264.1 hypothetical protein [Priestia megaterium]MDR7207140.1 hypothetical protein [Priestia megaterium]MED3928927.1 hypothetical protein [Priestia megaterium]